MDIDRSAERQGRRLGRYRLLRMLGRGGMGEVWLADDPELGRQVAIKLLPVVLASDKEYLDTFRYEARVASALEHPHILPVHDFGEERQDEDDIITYIVMPYIADGTLKERLRAAGGALAADEALNYLSQAAQAIDYAHSQHVLHRDIKPANMLLQGSWLLLADFGIARLLTTTTYRSQTRSGAGTPEYMAPEQVLKVAEPASDRYSLGIVAYQLFTGQLPFRGETPYEILVKQFQETPPAPRRFNSALPQAVEEVLLQGIAKLPEERLASCAAFVAALEHAWQGDMVKGEDPEVILLTPWNPRHYEHAATQRETPTISQEEAGQVEAMNPLISKTVPTKYVQRANTIRRRAIVIGGIAALVGGVTLTTLLHWTSLSRKATPPPPIVKRIAPPGPHTIIPGVPMLSLNGHGDTTHSAEWAPTGRYLATAGMDNRLMLWDVEKALLQGNNAFLSIFTPQHTWKFDFLTGDHQLCWSIDGQNIIVSEGIWMIDPFFNPDQKAEYYDLTALGDALGFASYDAVAWQPGTERFAASLYTVSGTAIIAVELWSRDYAQTSQKIFHYSGSVPSFITAHTIAWSQDGTLLAAYLALVRPDFTQAFPPDQHQVVIWQATSGQVQQVISLPSPKKFIAVPWKTPLAWSPIEAHLLAFGHWNNVILWDVQHNAPLLTLSTTDTQKDPHVTAVNVLALAWSPNGRYIAACYGYSRKIYIWDVNTLRHTTPSANTVHNQTLFFPQSSGAGHSSPVTNVSWSPDGRYIASTSYDMTVIVWRVDGA